MPQSENQTCFVIMPISDPETYEVGHFERVYEHLLEPACEDAGFNPIRADKVKATNYIVIDILQRIVAADMVLCDLSSTNPNVLYELGVRQAFNRPVTLVKDGLTSRLFDIQGFRYIQYDHGLRVDTVEEDRRAISQGLKETLSADSKNVNSLISLLGVEPASISSQVHLDPSSTLLLNAIRDLSARIGHLEENLSLGTVSGTAPGDTRESGPFLEGDMVHHKILGPGIVKAVDGKGELARLTIHFERAGGRKLLAKYANLKLIGRKEPEERPTDADEEME